MIQKLLNPNPILSPTTTQTKVPTIFLLPKILAKTMAVHLFIKSVKKKNVEKKIKTEKKEELCGQKTNTVYF